MFDTLSDRLSGILDKITGRGALSDADVEDALREVRRALLEADVALEVVKTFTDKVREKAVGAEIVKSVKPGQMVVKIVHDAMVETLGGGENTALNLRASPPVAILMVGLQGSGKTTTTAKIAKRLTERDKRRVLMASLDTRRPAAQEQLASLGKQVKVDTLAIVPGQQPIEIAKRAMSEARKGGYDIVMLDTAGRLAIDEELLAEAASVRDIVKPNETLLVADALTGQDAVNLARSFDEKIGISGIVLTRIDGDGRGGAALSMRQVTGKPIKLMGTGEKLDGLEDFHPERIAGRILGMGDVVSLVEKAALNSDQAKDALRAPEPQDHGRQAQEARGGRLRHQGRGNQPPSEDAHPDGRHDEADGPGQGPVRQDDGQGRTRCSRAREDAGGTRRARPQCAAGRFEGHDEGRLATVHAGASGPRGGKASRSRQSAGPWRQLALQGIAGFRQEEVN